MGAKNHLSFEVRLRSLPEDSPSVLEDADGETDPAIEAAFLGGSVVGYEKSGLLEVDPSIFQSGDSCRLVSLALKG